MEPYGDVTCKGREWCSSVRTMTRKTPDGGHVRDREDVRVELSELAKRLFQTASCQGTQGTTSRRQRPDARHAGLDGGDRPGLVSLWLAAEADGQERRSEGDVRSHGDNHVPQLGGDMAISGTAWGRAERRRRTASLRAAATEADAVTGAVNPNPALCLDGDLSCLSRSFISFLRSR
ncbi:hypothetical protein EVG20_g4680 [Dentipellis fragilis]|uniref:Uncharacterized protein n=1 Tax=Dentipellis fragilis TaxID=205917 RepID=A0A4Y9YVD4_9AGAM|nr:hypothetical protein EVG20_g4680 [Dentipellis fragilis]